MKQKSIYLFQRWQIPSTLLLLYINFWPAQEKRKDKRVVGEDKRVSLVISSERDSGNIVIDLLGNINHSLQQYLVMQYNARIFIVTSLHL
jgi:hypothetical protein